MAVELVSLATPHAQCTRVWACGEPSETKNIACLAEMCNTWPFCLSTYSARAHERPSRCVVIESHTDVVTA